MKTRMMGTTKSTVLWNHRRKVEGRLKKGNKLNRIMLEIHIIFNLKGIFVYVF